MIGPVARAEILEAALRQIHADAAAWLVAGRDNPITTVQQLGKVARDALSHLANARRSLEHARWQTTDRGTAARLGRLDELLRKLGRTVARTGR